MMWFWSKREKAIIRYEGKSYERTVRRNADGEPFIMLFSTLIRPDDYDRDWMWTVRHDGASKTAEMCTEKGADR